ncbi:MAG TPA: alpha/beta hydrolase [Actinophytocola sp.]|nr:alpha/beta hydrolase [Actinophytocola sp.]
MGERYLEVNGTRLFLDLRGDPASPPLLYLHGGPGASCHAFMTAQGDRLAERLHVVGLDQRGVLRSDALAGGDVLTEDLLVDDCEAVRAELGISRWTVLGHSFGGRVALRYALRHPDRVAAVFFENPLWDFDETERLRLPAAAAIFDELGDPAAAARCRELAARPERISGWRETTALIGRLQEHDRYDDLYFAGPVARARWGEIESAPFPEELLARSRAHGEQALDGCLESLLPKLAGLAVPADLIVGGRDLVCGPQQTDAFRTGVRNGRVHEFPQAGHFVVAEEPERYADLVISATDGGRRRFTKSL